MFIIFLLSSLSIIFPPALFAGERIEAFLLSAREDVSYLTPDGGVPRTSGIPAWINEAELRLKADVSNQQSYALRVRPKSGKERSAESRLADLKDRQRSLVHASALNDALRARYLALIDILEQRVQTDYVKERLSLVSARATLLRSLAQTTEFRPSELQDIELEHEELRSLAEFNLEQYQGLLLDHDLSGDNKLDLSISPHDWVVPLHDIEEVVLASSGDEHSGNYFLREKRLAWMVAKEDLQVTARKGRAPINFLELEYANQEEMDLGLTVGIKLPLGGRPSSVSRRKTDVMLAKTDLLSSERAIKARLMKKRMSLRRLSSRFGMEEKALEKIEARLSRIPELDVTHLSLDLMEARLERNKRKQEIHISAMRHYIDYLHLAGRLHENPLKNWIQAGTPLLSGA